MPFYDYRCDECQERFEEQRPIDRRDDAACPRCGSRHVRRLVSKVSALTGAGCGPSPSPGGG